MAHLKSALLFFCVLGSCAGGLRAAEPGSVDSIAPSVKAGAPSEPHTPEVDQRLSQSDRHLAAGKQLYFQGDLPGARREFDSAIDALMNTPENLPDHRRVERRLDEVSDLVYRFDIEKLGVGASVDTVVFDQAPIDQIRDMTFPVDPSLLPKLNSELRQTASAIPLDLVDPVVSYIHYFSTEYGRQVLLGGLRRAGRYRPMIQRILAEEGVPQELIYLAQAESGFLPRAISRARAVGMWQFISGTGELYALNHDRSVDERFDPEKATRAAARFLRDLYQRYGDWYLAMAAYNCGPGGVDRAIERTGHADYWELLKLHAIPRETANYVPIIVAMTIMAKNAPDYGLVNVEEDGALEFENIRLTAPTSLELIADAAQQPLSLIRDLNPALLSNVAPSGYEVHLPMGVAQTASAAIDSIPAGKRNAWRLHRVNAGETLDAIARQFRVPANRIVSANNGSDSLDVGDMLVIPAAYQPPIPVHVKSKVRSGSTRSSHVPVASSHASAERRGKALTTRVSPDALRRKAALRTASLR